MYLLKNYILLQLEDARNAEPEFDLLVPPSSTTLLQFVGGLGMNARLSKVSWDFFNIAIIGDTVLSIVDLLLSSRRDTFICLQVGEHCRHQLLQINFPMMIFSLFQSHL